MARMHSRRKGKSGSTKPVKKVPAWSPYKEKEVEKLVVKYAKAEKTASEIGMVLRDQYGIPSVKAATGKKVSGILAEHKLSSELPEDVLALIRKLVAVKQHREKNRQDRTSQRGELLTTSKIRRLIKYYQKTGRVDKGWQLDMSRLKMYLE